MKKTILQYVAKRQTKNEGVHERIYERTKGKKLFCVRR